MRAFKTVNDTYIEPVSFTVPRRAETFQSDIYPPCVGVKPAVTAQEWVAGKSGVPSKIDFESLYEGSAPVEIPSDYKPPTPVLVPAAIPTPQKAPEPTPAPASIRSGSIKEQQSSMAALASKYEDKKDDVEESSNFDEIPKPQHRSAMPARSEPRAPSPTKTTSAPLPKPAAPIKLPTSEPPPTTSAPAPGSGGPVVQTALDQIKVLLETQTKMLSAQSQHIERLTAEVDSLKKRVGSGSPDQSERIRQLELELEELRS